MTVSGLDHVNIRCRPSDLPALRRFWGEVIGLAEGDRPDFDFPGIWFWAGARPVVHIAARAKDDEAWPPRDHGAFGHVAFRAEGLAETRRRLAEQGIAFQEAPVPGFPLHQIFLRDPTGLMVELTFAT
ncbi:VOC family protein [Falsiroseomonas oryzae]|uniref:VOC family protein n=1 Tax=Falsiroseomonas oryzae TaxID=2766473 RepID=UPI0022EAC6BE|nr:VOC family protein [Roseomonas sp. MO-31]